MQNSWNIHKEFLEQQIMTSLIQGIVDIFAW